MLRSMIITVVASLTVLGGVAGGQIKMTVGQAGINPGVAAKARPNMPHVSDFIATPLNILMVFVANFVAGRLQRRHRRVNVTPRIEEAGRI